MKGLLGKTLAVTTLMLGLFAGSALAFNGYNDNGAYQWQNRDQHTGKNNSNTTGQKVGSKGLIKGVSGDKTHTNFKTNTNSCASCHMTHTANGDALLFGNDTQETCVACHDGSLGFYNVKTGELYKNGSAASVVQLDQTFGGALTTTTTVVASNAGAFDLSAPDNSMHSVMAPSKTVYVKAAPGGNYGQATTPDSAGWGNKFTCASCHAPHGSYSDRLLHYNPNGFGSVDVVDRGFGLVGNPTTTDSATDALGYPVYDIPAVATTDATNGLTFAIFRGTKDDHETRFGTGSAFADATSADTVVAVYEKKSGTYVLDRTPWLYVPGSYVPGSGYSYANNKFLNGGTDVKPGTNAVWKYQAAYAYGSDLTAVTTAKISRASVVDLDFVQVATFLPQNLPLYVTNNAAITGGARDANGTEVATTTAGLGVAFTKFCATCHTDYLSKSATAPQGHYNWNVVGGSCSSCHSGDISASSMTTLQSGGGYANAQKFRHRTDTDGFSCAVCHMSHGTNSYLMKDAQGRDFATFIKPLADGGTYGWTTAATVTHLDDVNPTSAIKRYTNMSVCWGCHTEQAAQSLVNNNYYDGTVKGLSKLTYSQGNRWGFARAYISDVLPERINGFSDNLMASSISSSGYLYDQIDRISYFGQTSTASSVVLEKIRVQFVKDWASVTTTTNDSVNGFGKVTTTDGTVEVGTITFDAATKSAIVDLYTTAGTVAYGGTGITDLTASPTPALEYKYTLQNLEYRIKLYGKKFK